MKMKKTMRAIFFNGAKLVYRSDYPPPEPQSGEATLRVLKAGLCRTDLEIIKGYMGFRGILGHEFVGLVEEAADETWVGQRVVGEINLPCRRCSFCRRGLERHCPERRVLGIKDKDGALAEYLTLPLENLHLIPDSLSDDEAVFVEPLAAALRVLEQLAPYREKTRENWQFCVLGDGKLGLLMAQVLKAEFPEVICVGRHPAKLALLAPRGIKTYLAEEEIETKFDVVVEATGRREGFSRALGLVRPEGIIFLKTTLHEEVDFNLSPVVVDEVKIIGSRCGPFSQAIKWLAEKRVNVVELIEAEYSLEEMKKAFDRASRPGALKVIFNILESSRRK